jgi:hypothetical protein
MKHLRRYRHFLKSLMDELKRKKKKRKEVLL